MDVFFKTIREDWIDGIIGFKNKLITEARSFVSEYAESL